MNANHPPEQRAGSPDAIARIEVPPRPASCCSLAPPSLPDTDEGDRTVPAANPAYQRALQQVTSSHPPWVNDRKLSIIIDVPGPVGSREGSPKSLLPKPSSKIPRSKVTPKASHQTLYPEPQPDTVQSRVKPRYGGRPKEADFSDSHGVRPPEVPAENPEPDQRLFPSVDAFPSFDIEQGPPIWGHRYRKLTGGDVCKEWVDVSGHKHYGHVAAVKVRPAAGIMPTVTTSQEARRGMSKRSPVFEVDIPPFRYPQNTFVVSTLDSVVADSSPFASDINKLNFGAARSRQSDREDFSSEGSHYPEDTVIHDDREQPDRGDIIPFSVETDTTQSLASVITQIGPFDADHAENEGNQHGHSHASHVRPAVHEPHDPEDETFHDTSPKVQPDSGDKTPEDQMSRSKPAKHTSETRKDARARRAETSTSELVAYWESLSEAPSDSVGNDPAQQQTAKSARESNAKISKRSSRVFEPRRATASSANSVPKVSPRTSNTGTILRDLTGPYEPYKTKLTELPAKPTRQGAAAERVPSQELSQTDSARFRSLTRRSRAAASLDAKFKLTVSNMEQLLNEAMILANQAVEQEDHECLDILEGKAEPTPVGFLPSVHESARSMDASTEKDEPLPDLHSGPATKAIAETTPSIHSHRPPKHHRSVPGMHSGNVKAEIPKRVTSLNRLNTVTRVSTPRDRFQESSSAISPTTHVLSSATAHQTGKETADDSVSESGCIFGRPGSKKGRCGSCRRIPLLNPKFSFQRFKVEDIPLNDTQTRVDPKLRPAGKSIEGRVQKSLKFDGANDYDGSMEETLLPETDGAGASEERAYPAPERQFEQDDGDPQHGPETRRINLRGKAHVSLRGFQGFSLARAYKRHPVARDWSTVRKRFVATVACLSTAAVGVLIGIYAGLVPSIQYWIADLEHYAILGNAYFYVGLAIPTFFFWPLPLLHGRKPYILSSLVLAMPLLFPQAIAVSEMRSPYVSTWRWALLSSRAFMGLTLGFASMNFHSILTDLFGASLMSGNPHQEIVDKHDVRRHGGGMGAWLGVWTWCYTGSLGVGFLIGAAIIDSANPSWGFYVSIILIMAILLLNIVCPEVRRSPFRRSVAEVRNGNRGQEVYHGVLLSMEMLRQPGFLVIALYTGWIYAQIVLIIVLLGALTSRSYSLRSPLVGLCVVFVSIGALIAIPFQKANLFSRRRHHQQQSNEDTFDRKFSWTSHLLRRTLFCLVLPAVGIAYTFASAGRPVPVEVPTLLGALIGILSGLAISECNGLIMETFDTSDLQPGMTGRPRGASNKSPKRTNYSSFPRVTAGFAICHTVGYVLAAVATAVGGSAQRKLGQQAATGVVAGILLILTLLLLAVLIRFKDVRIIPASKTLEMEKWEKFRRDSIRRKSEAQQAQPAVPAPQNTMTDAEIWRPNLMGNPSSRMRRMNILELGGMSRWTEIRKKNRLIDETQAHLNRAALESAANALEETTTDLVRRVSSRRSNRSPVLRRFHGGSPGPSAKPSDSPVQRAAKAPMELDTFVIDRPRPVTTSSAPGAVTSLPSGVMGQTLVEDENENIVDESDFISSSDDQKGPPATGYFREEAGHGGLPP
ncbi:hypothetical protein QBC35DRAFT_528884 [Podospora australis]|uniref:Polyamine transport protein n=1 Tax=Podospora australis TaxID=1536484 RepID=A0AAN6X053_9PEZI|nr:hypothetical protein QBC35DRAFT_528884 [Podospora australis]